MWELFVVTDMTDVESAVFVMLFAVGFVGWLLVMAQLIEALL